SLMDVNVPAHAPPLFIAVGSSHFNVTNGCLALFGAWKAAGKPAELHVYDQVSAGFGLSPRGRPVDGWIDRRHEWLLVRELTRCAPGTQERHRAACCAHCRGGWSSARRQRVNACVGLRVTGKRCRPLQTMKMTRGAWAP